jgi:hypothetical protein
LPLSVASVRGVVARESWNSLVSAHRCGCQFGSTAGVRAGVEPEAGDDGGGFVFGTLLGPEGTRVVCFSRAGFWVNCLVVSGWASGGCRFVGVVV